VTARGPRVLVVGSLNADLVVRTAALPGPGQTGSGSELRVLPGGKSANPALAAALLGADVALIGAVGAETSKTRGPRPASAARKVARTSALSVTWSELPHSTRDPSASAKPTVSWLWAEIVVI